MLALLVVKVLYRKRKPMATPARRDDDLVGISGDDMTRDETKEVEKRAAASAAAMPSNTSEIRPVSIRTKNLVINGEF